MDSIVNRLMDYINRNYSDLDYTQQDIIKYGLEILLIKLFFNLVIVILVGLLFGCFVESVSFSVFFSTIRSYAGGYHAPTRTRCFLQSLLVFLFSIGAIKLSLLSNYLLIFTLTLFLASSVYIWKTAPIANENKSLDENELVIFRKKTRIIIILDAFCSLFFYIIALPNISGAAMIAVVMTGFFCLLAKKSNNS